MRERNKLNGLNVSTEQRCVVIDDNEIYKIACIDILSHIYFIISLLYINTISTLYY